MSVAKKRKSLERTSLALKLRAARDSRGLTQQQAADLTGVALRTWINWENDRDGSRVPSGPMLRLLQHTFSEFSDPA
jgi:transcriptional regulator with XRE-family HTH domain